MPFIKMVQDYTPAELGQGGVAAIGEAKDVPVGVHALQENTNPQEGAGIFVAARDLNTKATLGIGTHQYLVLVPEDPSQFENMGDYAPQDLGDGTQGIIIGAHKVEVDGEDSLVAQPFEYADTLATREHYDSSRIKWWKPDWDTEVHQVNTTTTRLSNDEQIKNIIEATENYNRNERIPYGNPEWPWQDEPDRVNSNSWAQSVIEHVVGPERVQEDFVGQDVFNDRRIEDRFFEPPSESDQLDILEKGS